MILTMRNFQETGCRICLGIFLMTALLPSCTIKEGREDCPCLLEIDLEAYQAEGLDPDVAVTGNKGKVSIFKNEAYH